MGAEQGHHHDGVLDAQATSRSTSRSPTPSPSATPTTARCSARPIRTAITCGPAGSATTARAAARCSTTPRPATTGRLTPSGCRTAGVTWKIYQDVGAGLDAAHFWGWGDDPYIGNYGDNSLLYFHQYQNAQPGSPLFEGALHRHQHLAGRRRCSIRSARTSSPTAAAAGVVDRRAGGVSREHPNWPPNYGAWYISQVLDALTSNPEVWSKTAFFLMYDENDGFFDHMVPPDARRSRAAQGLSTVDTTNEVFAGNAEYPRRPVRPRRARADDRDLAVEQGRLGQLGGVRPHVADPLHRAALRHGSIRA